MTDTQQLREDELHMICIDAWANINDSLKKSGARFKGDGIGTAYGGWTALCEVVEPRLRLLLSQQASEIEEVLGSEIRGLYETEYAHPTRELRETDLFYTRVRSLVDSVLINYKSLTPENNK